ncbi:MAG: ATP-binding cassette domain-containing protein [Candidatus Tectomicrobia bacterium]|nr:ATP-binding cassette domain-containing protein [Candidatus Tectomicrobia bacterium]
MNGNAAPAKIVVQNIAKTFTQKKHGLKITAIKDLTFTVKEGEYLVIVGKTGAGKSVFFDCLLGLKEVSSGSLLIDGQPVKQFLKRSYGRITRIYQEDRLLPWRTATENAKLGLEILRVPEQEQRARAEHWLRKLGLRGFEHSYANELSGGMRQRVNIARAFATSPEILLMDEAFGGLDEVTAQRLRRDFIKLAHEEQITFLMVTHSIEEAIELGNRILIFGAPAHLIGEVRIPPEVAQNPKLARQYHDEILSILEAKGGIEVGMEE